MLEQVPTYVSFLFGITTLVTVIWFYWAANKSTTFLVAVSIWAALTSALALSGFFLKTDTLPPNFIVGIFPTLIAIAALFFTKRGRQFIDSINLKTLTYMNTVRVPVEIGLAMLFHSGVISVYQTFEGWNFDILSGLTAPIIAYLVFTKGTVGKTGLLIWNFVCLGLLLTIISISILASPIPIQQIAFDQPNIGILYFPFHLLPMVLVPVVLLGHLVSIRRLMRSDVVESSLEKEIAVA